jgi:hypothetical protein
MTLGLAILACSLAAGTCHAASDPGVTSYAVRVHAPAGTTVRLSALDVPRGWTASFCTPHVCSPFRVALPVHSGNAAIQLSYVRSAAAARPLRTLHVAARAAGRRADARRSVLL